MPRPWFQRAAQALLCAASTASAAATAPQVPVQPAPASAAPAEEAVDWDARVLDALAHAAAPGTRAAQETARALAGFGEPALPALLSALAERRATSAAGASLLLDEARLKVLREAVELVGRDALLAAAGAALRAHGEFPTPEHLPPYLAGIALCGRAADLGLALDLAAASEADELSRLAAQRGLEDAVRAVAQRDAAALGELRRCVARASPTMDLALLRGAAACGRAEALRALIDLFGEDDALTQALLGELPRAARGVQRPLDEALLLKLREPIAETRAAPALVCAALRAAAALGDSGVLPEMIERLRCEDAQVRRAANQALRELTGLLHGEAVEPWAEWLLHERSWYSNVLPELQHDLDSRDRGEAIAALRAIAQHRYRRDELALIAVGALAHESAQVRMEAIGTLGTLGSPAALSGLREQVGARSEREDAALRACIARLGGERVAER